MTDSVDWNAVKVADKNIISGAIYERGQQDELTKRIKGLLRDLDRNDKGDLEWLREADDDLAREYLLSKHGLGLKSAECVLLLALSKAALPVDTNVRTIATRLGWIPIKELPNDLDFDQLEMYPEAEDIHKYLWPRLCKLNMETLYELHYHLITFGKVFCTKKSPNCEACPLKAECKHYAVESARLSTPNLPAAPEHPCIARDPVVSECNEQEGSDIGLKETCNAPSVVEYPPSPVREKEDVDCGDIEDLGKEQYVDTLLRLCDKSRLDLMDASAKASVSMEPLVPERKNVKRVVSRLKTVHKAYVLEDGHRLLEQFPRREIGDPCPYLLVTWNSTDIDGGGDDSNKHVDSSISDDNSELVRATILIPSRTAMQGRFPLNGTYFQVNEVFADHESSNSYVLISKKELSKLGTRPLYCGNNITSICKGMNLAEIYMCFSKGFVSLRGMDRRTRAPEPLCGLFRQFGKSAPKTQKARKSSNWFDYEEEERI